MSGIIPDKCPSWTSSAHVRHRYSVLETLRWGCGYFFVITFPMIARPREPFAPHSSLPTRSSRLRRRVLTKVVVIWPFAAFSVYEYSETTEMTIKEVHPKLIPDCLRGEQRGVAGIMCGPREDLGWLAHCGHRWRGWGTRLRVRSFQRESIFISQERKFAWPNSRVFTHNWVRKYSILSICIGRGKNIGYRWANRRGLANTRLR